MIFLLPTAAAAPLPTDACLTRPRAAAFDAAVASAELAVRELDEAALGTSLDRVHEALPCVSDPLFPDQLARWYRAEGLRALVSGDVATGESWFRAARDALPVYRLDDTLGAPILEAWARSVPSEREVELPRPVEGSWTVDGRPASAAPTDHPWVVQWFGPEGEVRGTARLESGVTTPPWGVAPPSSARPQPPAPAPAPAPAPEVAVAARGHVSRGLAIGGVLAGLAAGAGIAQAADWQADFALSDVPSEDQPGLIRANRIVGYGAGGLGVAAVGLGVSAVAIGRW